MVVAALDSSWTPQRAAPRQQRGEETLARLLEAARALVREGGVEAMTLRDVARRAGRSPAAVYRYVRDRQELLALMIEQLNDEVCVALMGAVASAPPDPVGTGRAMVQAVLGEYTRDPAYVGAMLRLPPALGAWRTPTLPARIAELVHAAVAERAPCGLARDPALPQRLSAGVQALVVARHRSGSPSVEALEPVLVRFIVRSFGRDAARVTSRAADAITGGAFAVRERRPRRSDAQPGYEACCIAAAACVRESGLSVSTNAIAERAGVSVGSMFRYFPTKPALVAALAADVNDRFGARAAAAVRASTSGAAALDAVCQAALETWQVDGPLIAALAPALARPPFVESPPIPAELMEATRAVLATGTAFDDPELAAFVALHAGQALFLDALLRGEDLATAAPAIVRLLRAVLFEEAV